MTRDWVRWARPGADRPHIVCVAAGAAAPLVDDIGRADLVVVRAAPDDALGPCLTGTVPALGPGAVVLVTQPQASGLPPAVQAERLGDLLAHLGLGEVAVRVAVELDDAAPGGPVMDALADHLPTARVRQVRCVAAARGRAPHR